MARYTKPPLTYSDLVKLLESRNLKIKNPDKVIQKMKTINYYRLSAYMLPFKKMVAGNITEDFRDGITWEKVYNLYLFDRKLRLLVFDAIERIEIAIRSQLIYQLSQRYGSHWQDDRTIYKTPYNKTLSDGRTVRVDAYRQIQNHIGKQLTDNKAEVFIQHYHNTYSSPTNPPSWMSVEILYFGQLSIICENLANGRDLRKIANFFSLPPHEFVSWLHTINYIRNICAHHARLWNRSLNIEPALLRFSRNLIWLKDPTVYDRKKLYYSLCIINYFLQTINPTSHFNKKLKGLINSYKGVIFLDAMGFPENWKKEPMWKTNFFSELFGK